jgi:tetratricopeptide (TPR) repeat protein
LLENDSDAAVEATERAAAEDSTFAVAYFILYVLHRLDNRVEEAGEALDRTMTHIYKLPERLQYFIKSIYYDFKQEPDRQLAVLEMLVELYPDDLDSRGALANAYAYRNEMDKAIEQLQRILEFDPYNFDYVGLLVGFLVDRARFDEAQQQLETYVEAQPDDPAALITSGELYESQGDLDAARRQYDRALLIDPANVEVLSQIGSVETKVGRFAEAQHHYGEALRVAKTAQDKLEIHDALVDYHEMRGQMTKALEATNDVLADAQQFLPPLQYQFVRLGTLDRYVRAGETERAFALLDSVSRLIAPPLDKLASIGDVSVYLALEQPDKASEALVSVEEAVNALQIHVMDGEVWGAKGEIAVLKGDFEAGIAHYREQLALEPSNTSIHRDIGKCQRSLGQYEEAKQSILKRLATHPMDPRAHYELALVYAESGDVSKALEHLKKALEVWEEADSDYGPAKKAREKLEEWRPATSM